MNILEILNLFEPITSRQRKEVLFKLGNLKDFKDIAFECDFFGFRYQGHTRNLIDKHVYFLGCYEKGMLAFMGDLLAKTQRKTFIDIGANNGHHSLYLSRFAKNIFAFEPYELVRHRMEQQLSRNHVQNVTIFPFALGDSNAKIPFFPPSEANLGTGSFFKDFELSNSKQAILLDVFNGTELLHKLNIIHADLVKIDVEGFEYFVLMGLIPFFKKSFPVIIFEYSHLNHDLFNQKNTLMNFLFENYHLQVIRNPNCPEINLLPWTGRDYGNILCTPLERKIDGK
jgi:FkbM family methyltransferase